MKTFNSVLEETMINTSGYKGNFFWENYILSNMIKNLPSEIKTLGNKAVVEGYTTIFGETGISLFEFLVSQDIDILTEASQIKAELLFEGYGDKEIKTYLAEKFPFPDYDFKQGAAAGFGITPESPALKAASGTVARQFAVGGFISGAWEKLKSLGRAVFAPLIPYLQKGMAWAKGIAQQGLAWFNKTPWAKMILPLLLITGGVKVVKKLVNRVRRKKLNPEEEVALKNFAMKNNTKINSLRKQANLPPIKV
jgi:hypothetical protein